MFTISDNRDSSSPFMGLGHVMCHPLDRHNVKIRFTYPIQ